MQKRLRFISGLGRTDPALLEDAFAIRKRVFSDEQGFDAAIDVDQHDDDAFHIVAYLEQTPVAVLRVIHGDEYLKVGRVAVLKAYRGLGLGQALMREVEVYAQSKKIAQIKLSAQSHAINFYLSLGYQPLGESYLEEGVEHQLMVLSLQG